MAVELRLGVSHTAVLETCKYEQCKWYDTLKWEISAITPR